MQQGQTAAQHERTSPSELRCIVFWFVCSCSRILRTQYHWCWRNSRSFIHVHWHTFGHGSAMLFPVLPWIFAVDCGLGSSITCCTLTSLRNVCFFGKGLHIVPAGFSPKAFVVSNYSTDTRLGLTIMQSFFYFGLRSICVFGVIVFLDKPHEEQCFLLSE